VAVAAAREKAREAQDEARRQSESVKGQLKKLERQLAGVTGAKDAEIDRLQTRVATLEVTLRSRNAESAALQVQAEQAVEQVELMRQRLLAAQVASARHAPRLAFIGQSLSSARSKVRLLAAVLLALRLERRRRTPGRRFHTHQIIVRHCTAWNKAQPR
jgi:hypothetical protein